MGQALDRSELPEWERRAQDWVSRGAVLERIVTADAVQTMTKARELLYEFQCVLHKSTVLTDVRHVYNKNGDIILGGLILHTLSLEYAEASEPRQVHITLSGAKIAALLSDLQRAQRKADAAAQLLEKNSLPELTPKRNLSP